MPQVNQDALDYSNEAQVRVAADTRALIKKTTVTTVAGQVTYPLAADVIELLAVLSPQGDLEYLPVDEAMAFLSMPAGTAPFAFQTAYFSVGDEIGFLPAPTSAETYTLVYQARPVPLDSNTEFEVGGEFELLLERLVQAMKLDDDGQPELALEEQGYYDLDSRRLRRRTGRESRSRAAVVGFDSDL